MFGRNNIVKVIKKGDLNQLKKLLEKDPGALATEFEWKNKRRHTGNRSLLMIAASYNQPEIVKFLFTEKGMEADGAEALRWAAFDGSVQAAKSLLDLGANPDLKDLSGKIAFDYCSNDATRELLRPYHEAMSKQEAAAKEDALRQEAEAKLKGTWTSSAADEIVFEHDLPGHRLHLTETFNFATDSKKLITENLLTGQMSPSETKRFDELSDKEVEQARARFAQANGVAPAEARKPQAAGLLLKRAGS